MSLIVEAVREMGALWQRHSRLENDYVNLKRQGSAFAKRLADVADETEERIYDIEERMMSVPPATLAEAEVLRALAVTTGEPQVNAKRISDAMQALAAEAGLPRELIFAYVGR
jgi:hypothetical protein